MAEEKTYITTVNAPTFENVYEIDAKVFHNGFRWEVNLVGGHWPKVFLFRKVKTEESSRDIMKWVDVKYIRTLVHKSYKN